MRFLCIEVLSSAWILKVNCNSEIILGKIDPRAFGLRFTLPILCIPYISRLIHYRSWNSARIQFGLAALKSCSPALYVAMFTMPAGLAFDGVYALALRHISQAPVPLCSWSAKVGMAFVVCPASHTLCSKVAILSVRDYGPKSPNE